MDIRRTLAWANFLLSLALCTVSAQSEKDELFTLPDDYNKEKPPMQLDGSPVQVNMDLEILRDLQVKEMQGEITIDAFLSTVWKDPRLNVSDRISKVAFVSPLESEKLWKPDIVFVPMKGLELMKGMKPVKLTMLEKDGTLKYRIGCSITLLCTMDFSRFPMDVQVCGWKIYSFRHNRKFMNLTWNEAPLKHRSKTGLTNMKLPQYGMKFVTWEDSGEEEMNPKMLHLKVILRRDIKSHVLVTYFPSALFVIVSWGSFVVLPEVVPGRMVLLVTTLLTLVTMLNSVRQTTPESEEIKPIEVWIIACIGFVFLALFEYCVVLFDLRYQTTWGGKKEKRVDEEARRDLREEAPRRRTIRIPYFLKSRKREVCRQGKLDMVSLLVFPIFFIIFNIVYWINFVADWEEQLRSVLDK